MRLRVLLFLLATTAARAQTGAPAADALPADSLGTVTVTAARVALSVHDAPVHAVVVSREALGDAAVRSVAEALDARTPAVVRRYGAGSLASVSVRGAGAAQTLVLLDGQPLADPQLGQLDLSLLPSSLLESVEVTGGAASGLFGSGALGGVVGLRSDAGPGVRAAAEAGAWGERRLTARAAGRHGAFRGVVAAEASETEGDYAVPDLTRLGAPLVRREGWDGRQASVFAALRAEGRAGRAGLSLWAADAERGLGGTTVPQAGADAGALVGARQWDRLARLTATAARPLRWGTVSAALALTRTRLRYASPFPATRPDALDETGRTQTLALDVTATADRLAPGWTLTGLAAASEGRAWHPSLVDGARDRAFGAGASAVGRAGRLTLFPALRADLYVPQGAARRAAISPQFGASVALGAPWRLRASAGRAFRMPTLNDRFWAPGGNPDLRPESGVTADAGVAWQARGAHAEVTAFAARTRDLIVWMPGPGGVWSPENIARARTRGLDITAGAARLVRSTLVDGGAAVSLLDARDAETGFRLRYSPAWTARLWAGIARGAVRVDLSARAVGARPTTASGSQPLPAHLILGGQVRWSRRVGTALLGLGLTLDNLTDARYESVRSYPMPPRNARLRLTLDLP
jgi:outer membrane cobalamin receptor